MSILQAIRKFLFPTFSELQNRKKKRKKKHSWNHLNARQVTLWTRYLSDSGASDHSCRYKVVEGRTRKLTVERSPDGHRICLIPTTQKAVVLIWKRSHPLVGPHSKERIVVHLNKKNRINEDIW